ncbi:MAG: class I SAM-dependent methyltransferase [Kamptonema sp. SIO4C4]|nr:class I SAM-dependent methyltransferase [Kamptonema sp. SIO4C4]
MTTTTQAYNLPSQLINGLFAIKPLAQFAKHQARKMMVKRAESLGIPWQQQVETFRQQNWDHRFQAVQNPQLEYADYYLRSFHAYDRGNLCWEAAWEQEVAAKAVHAKLWEDLGADSDRRLRDNYRDTIKNTLSTPPQSILDLACGVGLSTFSLQNLYPQANCTGLDLSPHFLTLADYNSEQRQLTINWKHAAAEATGFPDQSFDFVSASFLFHELPQKITQQIFQEVRRILRPSGHFALLDSNPESSVYKQMPPYVFTLLKSTEPYLDEYFTLDLEQALIDAGFYPPTVQIVSSRHRSVITQVK